MADTPIISREEYKTYMRITGTERDEAIDFLLPAVRTAFRNYTKRDFGEEPAAPSERPYLYDGSGFVQIDDASSVTQVRFDTMTLPSDAWRAMPPSDASDPTSYWWIGGLPPMPSVDPAMGFTANWDVFGPPTFTNIYVTAAWGWEVVPEDVKIAAAWTIHAWLEAPGAFQSESIEGYSRTVGLPQGIQDAIPGRAQMILNAYDRGPVL